MSFSSSKCQFLLLQDRQEPVPAHLIGDQILEVAESFVYLGSCITAGGEVQRELLLRRRCRASPIEVVRIDKKLRRLDAYFRREDRRRRSADDLDTGTVRKRAAVSLAVVPDSDSDDGEIWDAEYPKGWGPDNRSVSGRRTHPFSMSPAIHSDPEPSLDWWRTVQEETEEAEGKEWNTCPEGYDYADAERARNMLRGDVWQRDTRTDLFGDPRQRQTHVSLSQCLFGLDDEDEDDDADEVSDDDDDDDDDVDALAEQRSSSDQSTDDEEDPTADSVDLSGTCWDPLREFM
ncbi:unnamed protein product [Echinostoma caproni]|uniref:DUF2052 domain-containing protein n=1 Tax=Echinostoma caproni TaxID=27848 RepID=A0A183AL20_9TREM|nr:unnamed protein product [Echinostoma caproni]